MTRRSLVRPVMPGDLADAQAILDADPIAHCFVASRVERAGADPWRLGGDLLGYFPDGTLAAMVFVGANLIPVGTSAAARAAFADRLRGTRRCSSLLGPAVEVLDLWRLLESTWSPAREVRAQQDLLVIEEPPHIEPDDRVRPATMDELEVLMPACVAMFTEEVGVSPLAGGNAGGYRARVAELIREKRALVVIDEDQVVFKAEIGVVGPAATQVQGVWVAPRFRGRGLSAPAMAAVVEHARRTFGSPVSLYVNDFNTPARKAYRRIGMRSVGTFATVLL